MQYFHVSFHYHVSREDIRESWKEDPENEREWIASPAQDRAAWEVDDFLSAFFVGAGIEMRHAYSYPDGSCYKYVKFSGTRGDLDAMLSYRLRCGKSRGRVPYQLRVEAIDEIPGDQVLTHRKDDPTIEQLFTDTSP